MSEAAKILGVHPKTIQRWDREGKIRCIRTVGGRRRVPESEIKRIMGIHEERKIVGYARVSSRTQKDDLERQIEAIKSYAREKGWQVEILKDIASGLNENRKNFRYVKRECLKPFKNSLPIGYWLKDKIRKRMKRRLESL